MKRVLFILSVFICVFFSLQAQQKIPQAVFYYYGREKIFLTEREDKIFLKLAKGANKENLLTSINTNNSVKLSSGVRQSETLPDFLTLEVLETKTGNIVSIVEQYKADTNVISASPVLQYNESLQGLADEFVVMLKETTSYKQFQSLLLKYHCIIVEENSFVKNQFLLSVTKKSILNALQLANVFYETGLFEFSEPNFIILNAFNSNDTYFDYQWGLKNTGQSGGTSGIDIKAEQAWAITQGNSNIKVAVVDQGVDLTHPDLVANLLSGYDASGNNSGGAPVWSTDKHGTACAGIIGALKDNREGISGVAPNCKIIPIHASNSSEGLPVDWAADAIQWAQQNGADVISNSWGGSSPYTPLTNAINSAVTQGRNGKGCVVVFSSGNNNASTVNYPASLSNVIAVGAVDRCGIRSGRIDVIPNSCDPWCSTCQSGSAYGSALDVVAPGTGIYTTDRQGSAGYVTGDYYSDFGGTSAACPHVAGIAALVLSVNPSLTQAKVRQIIESTCTKLQEYSFSTNSNHPNGTWNSHAGHGLVNAYAAVQAAVNSITISGSSNIQCSATVTYTSNVSGTWTVSSNLQIVSGQGTNSISVRVISGSSSNTGSISINGRTMSVTIGLPKVTSIEGPGIAPNGIFHFAARSDYTIPNMPDPDLYEWAAFSIGSGANGVESITKTYNYAAIKVTKPATYYVLCRSLNPCTNTSFTPIYKTFTVTQNDLMSTYSTGSGNDSIGIDGSSSFYSSAYPNPASNELIIDKTEEENGIEMSVENTQSVKGKASEMRVLLYSHSTARLVYNKTHSSSEKQIRIDVSKLPDGIYHLNMIENGEKVKEQTIIVNH